MLNKITLKVMLITALTLTGCNLTGAFGGSQLTAEPLTPTSTTPSPTALVLAPTLGEASLATLTASPTSSGQGGPTPLPAPTQIGAAVTPTSQGTADPAATPGAAPTIPRDTSQVGISITPEMGEPGDIIMVYGDGLAPNTNVSLHWSAPGGPLGPVYWEVTTDTNGSFTVDLIVPPAERWPNAPLEELEVLQLHAVYGYFDYFAGFTYVERFDPVTSLVQTMTSDDFNYSISLPNSWRWDWDEDEPEYVWFTAPSGGRNGFVRVVETTDVNAAISSVLSAEGLTAASRRTATLGTFPNSTEVTSTSGRVVWFISGRNRVYALSFIDDSGQPYTIIMESFRIL